MQTLQHSNCHFLPPESAALRFSINYLLHLLHIMHLSSCLCICQSININLSIHLTTMLHPKDLPRSPQLLSAQESIGILQPALLRCCGPGPGVMDGCTCQAPPAKLVGSNGIQFSTCPAVSNWCLWWATELVLQGMPAQVKHAETSFAEQLG